MPETGIRTFAIIKPDAFRAGHVGNILTHIRAAGFIIRASVTTTLDPNGVDALYGASKGKPWYPGHAAFMQSGPCSLLVLERANAVERWRCMIGAADPRKAEPGTLRALFGDQNQEPGHCYRNAVHGSDTDEAAEREIGIFFGYHEACGGAGLWAPNCGCPDEHRAVPSRTVAAVADCGCGGRCPECSGEAERSYEEHEHAAGRWPVAMGVLQHTSTPNLQGRISDVSGELAPPASRPSKAPRAFTLSAVAAEVQRGRRKFPGGRFLLAALVEEVGELAGAVATGNTEEAYAEAIQVAAVAVRIAEEGERTKYQMDRMIQAVVALGMGVRFLLQRNETDARASFGIAMNAARRIQEAGDSSFDDLTDEEAKP